MKHYSCFLLVLLFSLYLPCAAHEFEVEESDTDRRTIQSSPSSPVTGILVDNIFGGLLVTGRDTDRISVNIKRTILAESKEKLQEARRSVGLKIHRSSGEVKIITDGPFRKQDGQVCWNRDLGYIVVYDLDITVPRRLNYTLKTVDRGIIDIRDISGIFRVSNVNGRIVMAGIAGSGKAHTVNGDIEISFNDNPRGACSLRTVNGDVVARFIRPLAADFKLKTMTGGLFTDFEYQYLPLKNRVSSKRKNGKFVYKMEGLTGIRVGSGGPSLRMETLNGDIIIKQKGR